MKFSAGTKNLKQYVAMTIFGVVLFALPGILDRRGVFDGQLAQYIGVFIGLPCLVAGTVLVLFGGLNVFAIGVNSAVTKLRHK